MKAVNFAWFRERIGETEENFALIAGAREIALFSPMTEG